MPSMKQAIVIAAVALLAIYVDKNYTHLVFPKAA